VGGIPEEAPPRAGQRAGSGLLARSEKNHQEPSYKDKQELDAMEATILAAEANVEALQAELNDPELARDAAGLAAKWDALNARRPTSIDCYSAGPELRRRRADPRASRVLKKASEQRRAEVQHRLHRRGLGSRAPQRRPAGR